MSKQLEQKIMSVVDRAIKPHILKEAFVLAPKKFNLTTEKLSEKAKRLIIDQFEKSVQILNKISAQLDGADLQQADNVVSSNFRNLKISETYGITDTFLRAESLGNISDVNSMIAMDMLCYMRLARDFGDFDTWQQNFLACAKSSRNGFVVTSYNFYLKKYINSIVDDSCSGVPVGSFPVIVLDVRKDCYTRDYLDDIDSYVRNMMRELNWQEIEDRFKKAERMAKAFG